MTEPKQRIDKSAIIEKINRADDGSWDIVISTALVDGDQDTINQEGWRLERYLKNPIVGWAHDYRGMTPTGGVPIGTSNKLALASGKMEANFNFREPANEHDFVNVVRSAWDQGVLKAASVGFKPVRWAFNEERGGYDFLEQELLEWSVVAIPANQDALRMSYKAALKAAGLPIFEMPTEEAVKKVFYFTSAYKAQDDAPNYREASGDSRCSNCRFADGGSCTRFEFEFDADFICDDYEAQEEEEAAIPGTTKAGRVLNKRNEARLRKANDLLNEILDSLPEENEEEAEDEEIINILEATIQLGREYYE